MGIRHSMRLATCGAIAGSAVFAAVLPGGAAFAKTKPVKVVCTSLAGSSSAQTFSGCSDIPDTGGSGSGVLNALGPQTISWSSPLNSVVTITKIMTRPGRYDNCTPSAGYTNYRKLMVMGKVTGGTATDLVGGKVKATICLFQSPAGGITAANFPGKTVDF